MNDVESRRERKSRQDEESRTLILLLAVAISGVVGIIGLIVILVLVSNSTDAIIYAGLLGTFMTSIIGFLITVSGLKQLTIQTNHRMDDLIAQTKQIAAHAAVTAERKRVESERVESERVEAERVEAERVTPPENGI